MRRIGLPYATNSSAKLDGETHSRSRTSLSAFRPRSTADSTAALTAARVVVKDHDPILGLAGRVGATWIRPGQGRGRWARPSMPDGAGET